MVFTNDSGNYLLKCLASVVACTGNCPTNILMTTMSTMTKSLLYYKLQANNNNGRGMTPDLCYCDLWPVTMTAFFWRSTCRFCTDIQIFKLLQKHLMTNSVSNHREAYLAPSTFKTAETRCFILFVRNCLWNFQWARRPPQTVNWLSESVSQSGSLMWMCNV